MGNGHCRVILTAMELLERARELECLSEDDGEEVGKLTSDEEARQRAGQSLEVAVKKLKRWWPRGLRRPRPGPRTTGPTPERTPDYYKTAG
eukprot:12928157-Prorocentrum_lima.AAC.1